MKTKMKSYKKYFSGAVLAILFFTQTAFPAKAAFFGSTSFDPMDAANELIDGFGIDRDTMNSSIQTYNVSPNKEISPQVSLNFSPTNPQLGDKVTVTATPTYFINDTKKMYFTWFLKQNGCDQTNNPNSAQRTKCDLNNDGRVNIEDYKIKAMRIIANNDFVWENADYSHSDGNSSYRAAFGGDDQRGKNAYCYLRDITSGEVYAIDCNTHLFPDAPHENTGDGSFGRNEESFWHTNPTIADTTQSGNTDEANVAGLGLDSFTWSYDSGDKIGVVVEGIAVSTTQTADSSFKTMWAAPKGMCYKNSAADFKNVSSLNDCLYDNLTSPSENSASSSKLEVSLSYSPTSPINDPNNVTDPNLSLGDDITVQSAVNNANDNNYLQYSWEAFASDDPSPDSWGSPLPKSSLPNSTQMEGLGLDTFKFKLNLHNPKKYLNIKLTVKESTGDGNYREGHTNILIPIKSNDDVLSTFLTTATNVSAPHISMASEICTSAIESALCPIVKNKIIGVKIPQGNLTDFLWTVDGKPFTYSSCFFDGCNLSKQTNVAYFPALKEVGEQYIIGLTAINQTTNEKVSLSKTFKVVDPSIAISSLNSNTCKPVQLGNYIDLNGKSWPDYSTLNFWGLSNSSIQLQASTVNFPSSGNVYTWIVDGNAIDATTAPAFGYSVDANGVLTLPSKKTGEGYNVTATTIYSQDEAALAALNKYWNISYDQFYEKNITKDIIITMQDGVSIASSATPKKILATIYTSLPSYLTFILRITLTMIIILFGSQLILAFFPSIKREIK